ncbi:MAG: hypothetical protein J5616_03675 [Bacteroidaceae bacterium]|nr:hypothetical protein [Bacteroidaceae bacterium]
MTPFELIAQATQAIVANPADAAAYKQRAVTLFHMKQADEALADLDTLIDKLHSEDSEVYQLRAILRKERGDKMGAIDDMRRALDLNPDLLQQLTGKFQTE